MVGLLFLIVGRTASESDFEGGAIISRHFEFTAQLLSKRAHQMHTQRLGLADVHSGGQTYAVVSYGEL